jgi:hypothetical protein
LQGGVLPSWHTTAVPGGTTTVLGCVGSEPPPNDELHPASNESPSAAVQHLKTMPVR